MRDASEEEIAALRAFPFAVLHHLIRKRGLRDVRIGEDGLVAFTALARPQDVTSTPGIASALVCLCVAAPLPRPVEGRLALDARVRGRGEPRALADQVDNAGDPELAERYFVRATPGAGAILADAHLRVWLLDQKRKLHLEAVGDRALTYVVRSFRDRRAPEDEARRFGELVAAAAA